MLGFLHFINSYQVRNNPRSIKYVLLFELFHDIGLLCCSIAFDEFAAFLPHFILFDELLNLQRPIYEIKNFVIL
ncbi:hypothetical protein T11_15510 [Trichinella zimbabwensis]|uniref:Uncharacterized protein n=1 Tax=Trichinella zimbabwensis TaxID=268475 RepID=A0A0V1I6I5_9BILA|nr:hypothetical protein T11_15510 [Trichinella zimbabwensis]